MQNTWDGNTDYGDSPWWKKCSYWQVFNVTSKVWLPIMPKSVKVVYNKSSLQTKVCRLSYTGLTSINLKSTVTSSYAKMIVGSLTKRSQLWHASSYDKKHFSNQKHIQK